MYAVDVAVSPRCVRKGCPTQVDSGICGRGCEEFLNVTRRLVMPPEVLHCSTPEDPPLEARCGIHVQAFENTRVGNLRLSTLWARHFACCRQSADEAAVLDSCRCGAVSCDVKGKESN
jgi:hypothetical protein